MRFTAFLLFATAFVLVSGAPQAARRDALQDQLAAIAKPQQDWTNDFFAMTGDDFPGADKWHDASGAPNSTLADLRAFTDAGVDVWHTLGDQLVALVPQVDRTSANADYVAFLATLFPQEIYIPLFGRPAEDWSIGISLDDAKALASTYEDGWLDAIRAVEAVAPGVTRDYMVTYPLFFNSGGNDELYYFDKLTAYLDSQPWDPILKFCTSQGACNDPIDSYPAGKCYATGLNATQVSVRDYASTSPFRFKWTCQLYTDDSCQDAYPYIPEEVCDPNTDYWTYYYCQLDPPGPWYGQVGEDPAIKSESGMPNGFASFFCQ